MKGKHGKILAQIFKTPVPANIRWDDIEKLFINLGANVTEARGSRVKIELHGEEAVFHRPHPRRETDKGAVVSVRKFLINAGIDHDEI
jgi:hypothetical protein